MEQWKDIPWTKGFYEVSSMGDVRSKTRTYQRSNGRKFTAVGRPLYCHWSDGYKRVRLNVPGFPKWHSVHKLVMETFVGQRPSGFVIRHLDGDKANCALANLCYGTNAENQQDRQRHGTDNRSIAPRLLSDTQILEIRERRADGEELESLATEFRVSKSYIYQIATGKVADHIGGQIIPARPRGRAPSLTTDQITEIRLRRKAGEKIVPLGREFKVSHSLISKICRRNHESHQPQAAE